jgi:hypothetical protein
LVQSENKSNPKIEVGAVEQLSYVKNALAKNWNFDLPESTELARLGEETPD